MLAKYPWDPRASLRVGGFEQDHGDLDAAIGHYQNAVRIKPDYGDAHGKLAHALQLQGMPTEAIRHYRLALQYGPRDAFSHNNLGVILGSRGDVDQAVHHFRRALAIEPDDPRARKNLRTALKRKARTAAD